MSDESAVVTHKWYIEPLDIWTNEVLGKNQEFLCDEGIVDGARCSDGKRHQFWACKNHAFVGKFEKKAVRLKLKFKIW